MPKKREAIVNVGIDVGKLQLDVALHERNLHFTASNNPQEIRKLLNRLAHHPIARIVVEATGRREYDLVLAAAERGFPRHHLPTHQGPPLCWRLWHFGQD